MDAFLDEERVPVQTHSGNLEWVDGHELNAVADLLQNYKAELALHEQRKQKIQKITP